MVLMHEMCSGAWLLSGADARWTSSILDRNFRAEPEMMVE